MIVDNHCHLDKKTYKNLDEVIKKMQENIIIVSGYNDESNKEVISLTEEFANVYGSIGIQPEEIQTMTNESFQIIEKNLNNKKIVAVGEIGLDYHWSKDDKDVQQEVFIKQLKLAQKYQLPIIIHSRDAALDTYNILKEYAKGLKGVMHCYSYSLEMAEKFIELGLKIGVGGVITFKNAGKLRQVVKNISLENILLETDSPYLTPEPYRGQVNEPINVMLVAKKLAEIKGITIEEVIEVTTKNSIAQFDLPVNL